MMERLRFVAGLAPIALAVWGLILLSATITDFADYREWSPSEQDAYRNRILLVVAVLVAPAFAGVVRRRLGQLGWPLWWSYPATFVFGLGLTWRHGWLPLLAMLTILAVGWPTRGTSRSDP